MNTMTIRMNAAKCEASVTGVTFPFRKSDEVDVFAVTTAMKKALGLVSISKKEG